MKRIGLTVLCLLIGISLVLAVLSCVELGVLSVQILAKGESASGGNALGNALGILFGSIVFVLFGILGAVSAVAGGVFSLLLKRFAPQPVLQRVGLGLLLFFAAILGLLAVGLVIFLLL